MTIKKRLFISNIMMIVIPSIIAVIALGICLIIFISILFPHAEYRLSVQVELNEIRYETIEKASEWLSMTDKETQVSLREELDAYADMNHLAITIYENNEIIHQFGNNEHDSLKEALDVLDGKGLVSDGDTDLFGTDINVEDNNYQMYIYNPVTKLPFQNVKVWVLGIVFFMVVIIIFIIYLTNRFLTKFVFQKISEPLQILTEGVHQIEKGNLTYQIMYDEEDEFKNVCEDFNDMAVRLKQSVDKSQKEEKNRKELLASISHDIRSPLTSIRAYVEGLLDGVADTEEKQKMYLQTIQDKTKQLDQLVKKIFLFSKMDMDDYPYDVQRIDAVEEINDFLDATSQEYDQQGLMIVNKKLPKKAVIEADPVYFRSIFMNLLDNSAKYKNKDIVHVSIYGKIDNQTLKLMIDDDGPGVPEEALMKIFDVFYRNDPSRNHPYQGSGLGLAIVAKSIQQMKGSIRAENITNGGLRMIIELPLVKGES